MDLAEGIEVPRRTALRRKQCCPPGVGPSEGKLLQASNRPPAHLSCIPPLPCDPALLHTLLPQRLLFRTHIPGVPCPLHCELNEFLSFLSDPISSVFTNASERRFRTGRESAVCMWIHFSRIYWECPDTFPWMLLVLLKKLTR